MEESELEVIVAAILATGITVSGQQPVSEEYSVNYFANILAILRKREVITHAPPAASPVD